MDVLLTHPHFWPYVRRGAEREIHDLGQYLGRRGHRVRLLTSMPTGVTRRQTWGTMPVRYLRLPRLAGAGRGRGGVSDVAAFAAVALPAVLASAFDVVHAFHYGDAWAAVQARRVRRRPVVLKLTGTVLPDRMAAVRFDRRLFREAVERTDAVWCNSKYAAEAMSGFGRAMDVVPAGVDLDRFHVAPHVDRQPVVLCTSAPADPRKRLPDLLAAWPLVRTEIPDARLVLAGQVDTAGRENLLEPMPPSLRSTVEFVGDLGESELVDAYQRAAVAVSPGVHEALGLSTLEALACGTPVAGARSGATVELLAGDVGCLYESGDTEECAAAIVSAFRRSEGPDAAMRCRAAAEPYGWDRVAQDIEHRYRDLVERR